MHEMSLAEGVLLLIEDAARDQSFHRVKKVWLEVGQLAGVEADAMRFCFDAVMRDSIADGAELEIVETRGQAWCMKCSQTVEVRGSLDGCPLCGSHQLQVTGGNALRVKELEVE
ncbi:MAG: hydrogenase maturation nickel metallochaperone HypA [Polyangiaceae bacterium]|nr:hydrogenase maturation nickel metallochaperone HypA [Polyangiaceae bacterium]